MSTQKIRAKIINPRKKYRAWSIFFVDENKNIWIIIRDGEHLRSLKSSDTVHVMKDLPVSHHEEWSQEIYEVKRGNLREMGETPILSGTNRGFVKIASPREIHDLCKKYQLEDPRVVVMRQASKPSRET